MTGKLVLLNLPIGNIEDITTRSKKTLENETYFIAEDTRNLVSLMGHLKIDTKEKKIISFHEHSQEKEIDKIIQLIQNGKTYYLVSDAGSPIISDPAYPLVKKAVEQGIELDSYSGISSMIMALELSALPPVPFQFHGFFPREDDKRKAQANKVAKISGTHLFFESPHRILNSLDIMCDELPDCQFVVARELTKKFQAIYRFSGHEYKQLKEQIKIKGEFIFMVHIPKNYESKTNGINQGDELKGLAQNLIETGVKAKDLSRLLGKILGKNSKEIYSEIEKNKRS